MRAVKTMRAVNLGEILLLASVSVILGAIIITLIQVTGWYPIKPHLNIPTDELVNRTDQQDTTLPLNLSFYNNLGYLQAVRMNNRTDQLNISLPLNLPFDNNLDDLQTVQLVNKTDQLNIGLPLHLAFDDLLDDLPTDQLDIRITTLARQKVIPPNPRSKPYKLENKEHQHDYTQDGIQPLIDQIFGKQPNGVFVEAGAFDGETFSTSLYLEKNRGWSGLLVEPNLENLEAIHEKIRKAWLLPGCLSPSAFPTRITMAGKSWGAHLINGNLTQREKSSGKKIKADCFPLFSVLSAINMTTIDWFSLDVESAEMLVLRTIPFSKVNIKVWFIEWNKVDHDELTNFMETHGYQRLINERTLALQKQDVVYIKANQTLPIQVRNRS